MTHQVEVTEDEAIEFAARSVQGMTSPKGPQGWHVLRVVPAEEFRRLRDATPPEAEDAAGSQS